MYILQLDLQKIMHIGITDYYNMVMEHAVVCMA